MYNSFAARASRGAARRWKGTFPLTSNSRWRIPRDNSRSPLTTVLTVGSGIGVLIGVTVVINIGSAQEKHEQSAADERRSPLRGLLDRIAFHLPQRQYLRADSPGPFSEGVQDVKIRDDDTLPRGSQISTAPDAQKSSSFFPNWQALGDKIADALIPDWAQALPMYINKLQYELSMEEGTLVDEMWKEAHDAVMHPEIEWHASVRISDDLCPEEQRYLQKRKLHVRKALAKYLDVPEGDIHPDDVPVIGICSSGGGLRAMVAGTSSYLSAQECGLFDCVTYTAGVSGSCWAQALYHSSLTHQNFGNLIDHLKARIGTHIAFPPPLLTLLTSAPTHTYLMSGGLEKYKGIIDAEFGLVDIYGLLLAARLMVPKGELDLDALDLKLSHQRRFVDSGAHPLPIYTAVRHDIPQTDGDANVPQDPALDAKRAHEALKNASFQWFEFTPYELYSSDLGAGIPTWAVGRNFSAGHSVFPAPSSEPGSEHPNKYLPEMRLPLLLGIYGSAFCATLAHYYKEIRPLVKSLTGFTGLDSMLEDNKDDLVQLHPVEPAQIPNYALGLEGRLAKGAPASMGTAKHIQLMDAGMSNNLPIYPLLRRGRDVDVLVVFDASADVMSEDWLGVADKWAREHGVQGWPEGAGWPEPETESGRRDHTGNDDSRDDSKDKEPPYTLGALTTWTTPTLTLLYLPLLPHPSCPGIDPQSTPFLNTFNFVYTPDQVEQVVGLARANFQEGEERVKCAVRAAWEGKRRRREEGRDGGRRVGSAEWRIAGKDGVV